MTFVTLIDVNKRIGDACGRAIAAMEKADLARPAVLTSAASAAYRMFFNGLLAEHGPGPDSPLEWATRSARTVILIRELAGEYRMLAETSEEYDTQQVLRQAAIALNTVANGIEDLQPEAEPEPEAALATHSTMIDWDDDIKEAYQAAVKSLNEAAAAVEEERNDKYVEVFSQLLWKACARQEYVNATTREKKLQLIEAAVIVKGIARELHVIWLNICGYEDEEQVESAEDAMHSLSRAILNAMPSDDTEP